MGKVGKRGLDFYFDHSITVSFQRFALECIPGRFASAFRRCLVETKRFIADLRGAVRVTRASSSGPIPRICRRLEARAGQTRMVWLPSTRHFTQLRDEPTKNAPENAISATQIPDTMGLIRTSAMPSQLVPTLRRGKAYRDAPASRRVRQSNESKVECALSAMFPNPLPGKESEKPYFRSLTLVAGDELSLKQPYCLILDDQVFQPTGPRLPSFRAQRSGDPESRKSAVAYGFEAFGGMTQKT